MHLWCRPMSLSPADLERFVDAAVARWGRLDGLVNNAGKSAAGRIDQVSDDDWIADLNLKVLAAVRCTRLAVPHLIAAGGGAIVNVLNIGAKAAGAASLPTTASRAAGLAITKAASKDLGGHGIRVNAVLIGLVASGQWRRRADAAGQSEEELYRQMAQNTDIPLGRVGRSGRVRRPGGLSPVRSLLLRDRLGHQSRRRNQPSALIPSPGFRSATRLPGACVPPVRWCRRRRHGRRTARGVGAAGVGRDCLPGRHDALPVSSSGSKSLR